MMILMMIIVKIKKNYKKVVNSHYIFDNIIKDYVYVNKVIIYMITIPIIIIFGDCITIYL